MRLTNTILLILAYFAPSVYAQTKLTPATVHPEAHHPVVIEVNVDPRAANTSISWGKESGEGEFKGPTVGVNKVEFVPTNPGDVVIIVCLIKTPDGEEKRRTTLTVAGQAVAASPKPEQPKPEQPKPEQPKPVAPAVAPAPAAPGAALLFRDLPEVIPSGYMGDAMKENGESAKFDPGEDRGCRIRDTSCFRVEYAVAQAKLGWAAFAWQRVTEGSDNWGQSPGLDLGHDYQSLRIWAKGQEDAGNLPRVQFKSGGNVAPEYVAKNKPSHNIAGPTVRLTKDWAEYCLDLSGKDLSNVISPLTVVVTKASNTRGAVFFVDDLQFSHQPCRH